MHWGGVLPFFPTLLGAMFEKYSVFYSPLQYFIVLLYYTVLVYFIVFSTKCHCGGQLARIKYSLMQYLRILY